MSMNRVPYLTNIALFLVCLMSSVVVAGNGHAQQFSKDAPVNFDAENLYYDEPSKTVIARGDVRLEQLGRILRADEIIYSVDNDLVVARGNVQLTETDGTEYFANEVQFADKMREGYVMMLRGRFTDGGRFTAREGERRNTAERGDEIIMQDATYTACRPCRLNPEAEPTWQLKASEVTHHRDEHTISYRNAVLNLGGYSVLWTPYFSHPDGTVTQKSGLVDPVIGFDSELGTTLGAQYYYAIAPDKDASVGLQVFTNENPLLSGEYRQRFNNASVEVAGEITRSSRPDRVAGIDVETKDETRGHVTTDARWDINDKWRTGANLEFASDDQFLRQYDLSDKDVLENEIYAERFSGRNYAAVRALGFQDVRILEKQQDQPNILPEMELSYLGKPAGLMGGRWSGDLSALGLQRFGGDQDLSRISGELGWERSETTGFGLINTLELSTRGDFYYVSDRDLSMNPNEDDENTQGRIYPQAHIETRYPFSRGFEASTTQAVIEPVASLTFAPNISDERDIPNEDSQDAQIDANNIFERNRFPGYDRVEDRSRITYGLRSGLYADKGTQIYTFVGQSHNFSNDDNPFPQGSGLSEQNSDIVAEVRARYEDNFELNYRTQFANQDLSSRRHEFDAMVMTDYFELQGLYFFTKALEGTNLDEESREQVRGDAKIHLTRNWSVNTGAAYDLGEDPGLRKATVGFEYTGDCVSIATTAERELTDEASGDSGTEFYIRLGLKNLGNFETSGISVDAEDE